MHARQPALDPALETVLVEAIASATCEPARIAQVTEVGGGSISRAFRLDTTNAHYFLKVNTAEHCEMFAAEADGLEALSVCKRIRVPRVVTYGACGQNAYLLLEYVELHPLRDGDAGRVAGMALADLHKTEGRRFGWHRDNFIGSTPQRNGETDDWPSFFANRRLKPQLELAREKRFRSQMIANGERLIENLPALFSDHAPKPGLLHGDLWSGNAALDDTSRLALFDPAIHYGDRESDLAMMQLFGGFPASMVAAYRDAWPLATGFEQRRTLYQLYHVLNHMNLFGDSYQAQAERMIGSLLAEVA